MSNKHTWISFNVIFYTDMSRNSDDQKCLKTSCVPFTKDLFKRPPEIIIEYCVYNGIEGAVAVTKPEKHFEECFRYKAGATHSSESVCEEKREPAEDKHPHDNGQNKCKAPLSVLPFFPPACSLTRLHWGFSWRHLSNFCCFQAHLLHSGTEDDVIPVGWRRLFLLF